MRPKVEVLAEAYRNHLYAAAFSVCRNPQDAEDVVQDTLLQYFSQNKDFESEQHIRAWLLRVAINKAKNKTLALFRRRTVPLEDIMETLTFENEEDSALFEAVMRLPEKNRVVIHLFYYEDYSVREIAEILKISEDSVKTRLSRGRRQLRSTLKEAWDDDE